MKTAAEIIKHLENEMAYCLEMHKESDDKMDALQYLIQAATIEALLAEIKAPPVLY